MGPGPEPFRFLYQFQTVNVRHPHIGQYDIHFIALEDIQRVFPGKRFHDDNTVPISLFKLAGQPFHDIRFVVYDQKCLHNPNPPDFPCGEV